MKKFILSAALFLLVASMFIGCASTSEKEEIDYSKFRVGMQSFQDGGETHFRYWIIETPEELASLKMTTVFYFMAEGSVGDVWKSDKLVEIQNAVRSGQFTQFNMGGKKYIYVTKIRND